MEKIAILNDPVEASLLEAILNEEGIPHLIRSLEDNAYGNLFQLAHGWGELWGLGEDKARLKLILDELRREENIPLGGEIIPEDEG